MDLKDGNGPPAQKRRFFDDEPAGNPPAPQTVAWVKDARSVTTETDHGRNNAQDEDVRRFGAAFAAFLGEQIPPEHLKRLRDSCGSDIQRALNMYLDGPSISGPASVPSCHRGTIDTLTTPHKLLQNASLASDPASIIPQKFRSEHTAKGARFIGAFGSLGWATRSGTDLIKPGEKVAIGRSKPQSTPKHARIGKRMPKRRQDVVVRFSNASGEELGRLESQSAVWVSPLLDQKVCFFEGSCVYAPDKIRTNDNIYLQLRAYLLRDAFETRDLGKPAYTNREAAVFEDRESHEERNLRLRQVAMAKLFDEIDLHPTHASLQAERHKRGNLLKAAQAPDKYEHQSNYNSRPRKPTRNEPGTHPSEEAEEGQELKQEQLTSLYDKAQSFDFDALEEQPATTFAMHLRKYQKQALYWMISKEKDRVSNHKEVSMHPLWEEYAWPEKDIDGSPLPTEAGRPKFYMNPYSGELSLNFPVQEQNCLGGILADEMGLGKTIEILSLIHSHTTTSACTSNGVITSVMDLPRLPVKSPLVQKATRTTLVVAPMSLLAQWQSEAERASKPGTIKTMVYYGSDKTVNLQKFCCEANESDTPIIVITSYGVVLSEFNQVPDMGGNRDSHGGLFSVQYLRIVLDEAHYIKNRHSKTAKACYELSAQHRWALTGTPIVNRLEDLFSLVHFLRVEPWSNFSYWRTFITVPFESGNFIRALDVVQTVLEPLVMRRTKDMKTPDGKALVALPTRTIEIEPIELSKAEKQVYDWIYTRAKQTFAANVEAGTLSKSYTTIFAQILRLRQSCCHPSLTRSKVIVAEEENAANAEDLAKGLADDMDLDFLIQQFETEDDGGEQDVNRFGAHALKQIQAKQHSECPICAEEPMVEQCVTGCWHSACKQCLLDFIEHQRDKGEIPLCFKCRKNINSRDVFMVVRRGSYHDDGETPHVQPDNSNKRRQRVSLRRVSCAASAKVEKLLAQLEKTRHENATVKSIVFSQFTSFLDLIEPALKRDGIRFVRLDGSMAQMARAAVLDEFNSCTKTVVMLLSLRVGGVGLNLTAARHVYMMDPWWSFAVEAQAINRVHRMGQTAPVIVKRFIVRGSIEEKMLKIQEQKKFIATSLGMMSDEERKVQRIEDIKELLSED